MKPIIEYFGKGLFMHGQGYRSSIVQKREGKTMRNFSDKQEFTDFVDAIKPSITVTGYATVKCGCGQLYEYQTKDDIPATNVDCVCGRHIITYS